jgi:hypothetical protein
VVKAALALHERGELAPEQTEAAPDLQQPAVAVPES